MTNKNLKNEIQDEVVKPECIFECECLENKRYRLVFDGGDSGQYVVDYCKLCYDQDDKQFMISTDENNGLRIEDLSPKLQEFVRKGVSI